MTPERWARIEQLFVEAFALPAARRAAFLDQACGDDLALRGEVTALLQTSQATGDFLDRPVSVAVPAGEPPLETLAGGLRLGPWVIESLIGRGGMGEVYAVQRADGAFELRAAAKLLKRGLDTDAVVRRFLRERRILAQLAHPNIAHLLDAGVAPDDRPYLVMEYVEGVSITEHAESLDLAVAERLRLMITVCEAVTAAHARGIVHRDLKPSNVMVTPEGQVKLLDFGIAKLVDDDEAESTRVAGEAMPLTPAYAAPEQLRGEPVTPAADVYALGVMLYQLLVGKLPHAREGLSPTAIVIGLPDETTSRPSTVLRKDRGRIAEPMRLARLRGITTDLDLIALKALHAEVSRRYPTAREFADDLQRLLSHRPVLARPDSFRYRTARFVRRNRTLVAAAAAVVIALGAGLGAALWQAERATQAARRAEASLQRAEHVKDFMLSFINEQDRFHRQKSQAQTTAQLIQSAIARADRELGSEPEAHAAVLQALATIAIDSGDIDIGRTALFKVLAENRQSFGPESSQVGDTLAQLAETEYFGNRARSPGYARDALTIFQHLGEVRSLRIASISARLGLLEALDEGKLVEGEAHLRQALDIYQHQPTADEEDVTLTLFQLAGLLTDEGRDLLAEPLLQDAIARIERLRGPDDIRLQAPLRDLGFLLVRAGRYEAALAAVDRSLQIARHNGAAVDARVADGLRAKAHVLTALHRYGEAMTLAREALASLPEGADAYRSAVRRVLARLCLETGRTQEAVAMLTDEAEASRIKGVQSLYAAQTSMLLGRALGTSAGEALQRATLASIEQRYGADFGGLTGFLDSLADSLDQKAAFEESISLRRRALAIVAMTLNDQHHLWAQHAQALAHSLILQRSSRAPDEAGDLLDRALAIYRSSGSMQPDLGFALLDLGDLHRDRGDLNRARALWHDALRQFEQDPAHPDLPIAQARHRLATRTT